MDGQTQREVRIIARLLDERAEELDGLIVIGLLDGQVVTAYTAMTEAERQAMLEAVRRTQ